MTLATRKSYVSVPARVGIFLLMLLCIQGTHQIEEDQPNESGAILSGPLYELGGKLLNQINKQSQQPGNVIMSPVSIHQALSMVLLGSDDQSQTKQEIQDAIGYSKKSEKDIERCNEGYANVMSEFAKITQDTLQKRKAYEHSKLTSKPESPIVDLFTMMVTMDKAKADPIYAQSVKKYFNTSMSNIDSRKPETRNDLVKKLNDWAKEARFSGPIIDTEYFADHFAAFLFTAIRVEFSWSGAFEEHTGDKIFFNHGLKDKPVAGKYLRGLKLAGSRFVEFTQKELAQDGVLHDHMSKDGTFNKLSRLNFRAIEVPLVGGMKFAIFEPVSASNKSSEANSNLKLHKLVSNLFSNYTGDVHNSDRETNLAKAMELIERYNGVEISVEMPKFKFESEIGLKPILKSIGIKRVFDRLLAQVSKITGNDLFVEDVQHNAFIETTKTGIKAAAVTSISYKYKRLPPPEPRSIYVRVKNPFMFVLHYQKMPLFVGQLTNL